MDIQLRFLMKILKSKADDYLIDNDDQFNQTIIERLHERLLWFQFLRRERRKRHLDSLRVMGDMLNGRSKETLYSGQLSKPIRTKDSLNKMDKRIKDFIFLMSKESRNLIPIKK